MANTTFSGSTSTISCDQALKIARTDAEAVYRDLSIYRISIALEDAGWLVDYELKDEQLHGGGPHFVIDAQTGDILSKRYDQ